MESSKLLHDTELVDCARANADQGLETTAHNCGYGNDIHKFSQELRLACERMNLQVKELNELISTQGTILKLDTREIIAPETASEL